MPARPPGGGRSLSPADVRRPLPRVRRPLPPRGPAGSLVLRGPAGSLVLRGPAGSLAPNATLVEREDICGSIVRLRVRPDDGVPPFRPGQYFALGLDVGGRLLQRPYSTASPAGEAEALEFLIRLVPCGELTPRLWPLGVGARLRLGRPKGLFTANPEDERRPVFVATGTGIAPLLSMIESRPARPAAGELHGRPIVVHGVARASDLAYRERLESFARDGRITYLPAVSRPADPANAGWSGATGRLDSLLGDVLTRDRADPADTIAFVCGSPAMTEVVSGVLRTYGLPPDAVRSEAYWVAAPPG